MQVKQLRVAKGWSQEQLAEFSGLNVRTIQRIEKGQKASAESLKALAAVFELEIDDWGEEEREEQVRMENDARKQAAKHVEKVREFYTHIGIYIITNLFLFGLNLFLTPAVWWFHYPLFCWVVGLALHAFTVYHKFDQRWEQRQIEKRMDKYR